MNDRKPDRWDFSISLYRQHLPTNIAFIHERYDELLPMTDLPPAEKAAAIRNWRMPPRSQENLFGYMLMPAVNLVMHSEIRYLARRLCTAAGIACERYRLKHGKWPAKLDDLNEFGMPKNLIDPFDGQPLRYALLDDGAVVYSIDEDGRDDSGDVVRRKGRPPDIGFRLWNVDKRRVEREVPEE